MHLILTQILIQRATYTLSCERDGELEGRWMDRREHTVEGSVYRWLAGRVDEWTDTQLDR